MKRLSGIHHLRLWLSILMIGAISSAGAQTLAEAVSTALMTSPELHLAMQKVQTRVYEQSIAKSGFLPRLNVQGGSGYEWSSNPTTRAGGPDSDDRLHRYESSIALRQVLFAGFSTIHDSNRSKATTRSEQYRLITTASEMALNVAQSYLTVIMMERALAMSEQNLKIHQDIFYNIFKRSESGVQSTADLSLVGGRLARAQSNTIAADNNLQDARYNLFNGGADSGRIKASLSRWNEAKDIYHQALLDTQQEARLAWEAYTQLNRQIPQLQKHVTYSLDTVSAYRRQFAFGERSLLDVLNAENESLEAELAWNRARAAQLDAFYRMLHITGRLLESLRLTLPPDWIPGNGATP